MPISPGPALTPLFVFLSERKILRARFGWWPSYTNLAEISLKVVNYDSDDFG